MPKTSKTDQKRASQSRLTREEFFSIMGGIRAARQELDDANMNHAGLYKSAEAQGVHNAAAKLFLTLNKMEPTKRTDFLRAFDRYRSWSNWGAQLELLQEDEQAEPAEPEEAKTGAGEGEEERDPVVAELVPPIAAAEPAEEEVEGPDAHWGEEQSLTDDPTLEGAGFTFAAGEEAGIKGYLAEANPHAHDSAAHGVWEKGRAKGESQRESKVDQVAEAAQTEPAQASSRRSRRSAADVTIQ